jgi:single-stranded DNA-binding protein
LSAKQHPRYPRTIEAEKNTGNRQQIETTAKKTGGTMPTYAHATVICHLSADPEQKMGSNGKPFVNVRAWTKDRDWRDKEKVLFTSWRGILSGPPAEWLVRDGHKGSLVMMSGTIRVDIYKPADGEARASIEFTRLEQCTVLDRDRDGEEKAPTVARHAAKVNAAATRKPTQEEDDSSDAPPF